MPPPQIQVKRAYDPPHRHDSVRVLVDRLWPRGVGKAELKVDHWLKDLAPSPELRKWFDHDPAKWSEFKRRYFAELRDHRDALRQLLDEAGDGVLTLVSSAMDEQHNNAVALREYRNRINASRRR